MRRFEHDEHAQRQEGCSKQAGGGDNQKEDHHPQEEDDCAQEGGRSQVCFGE
jgi:hypothetical protein